MTATTDIKTFYWNWLDHPDDPSYERRIDEILADVERRVTAFARGRPYDVAHLLELVDRELGRADSFTERLRRERWRRKIDTVTGTLRREDFLLDCGSGFGTEAIAFAMAGARVTAVDVFPVYLRLVRKRAALYGRLFGVDLSSRIECVSAHLPEYEPARQFDVVWSNESIEHIAPLDRFLARLPGWLRPGGRVVICNDNAMNPLRMLATIRARGSIRARVDTRSVPGVAGDIQYGNEVIRSPLSTIAMLRRAGLKSIRCSMMSVFPSQFVSNRALYRAAHGFELLSRVPGLRLIAAGDYILVARP